MCPISFFGFSSNWTNALLERIVAARLDAHLRALERLHVAGVLGERRRLFARVRGRRKRHTHVGENRLVHHGDGVLLALVAVGFEVVGRGVADVLERVVVMIERIRARVGAVHQRGGLRLPEVAGEIERHVEGHATASEVEPAHGDVGTGEDGDVARAREQVGHVRRHRDFTRRHHAASGLRDDVGIDECEGQQNHETGRGKGQQLQMPAIQEDVANLETREFLHRLVDDFAHELGRIALRRRIVAAELEARAHEFLQVLALLDLGGQLVDARESHQRPYNEPAEEPDRDGDGDARHPRGEKKLRSGDDRRPQHHGQHHPRHRGQERHQPRARVQRGRAHEDRAQVLSQGVVVVLRRVGHRVSRQDITKRVSA